MLMSAVFAFLMPFETFLFAYAFLGPLHYLTEISWLHDKQYFTKGKYDFTFLLIIGVVLSIAAFANDFKFLNFDLSPPLVDVKTDFVSWYYNMSIGDISIMLALFSAVLFVLFKNIKLKLASILILYVIVYFSFNLDMDLLGIFILLALFSAALFVFVKNVYIKLACIALLYFGIYYNYNADWFGLDTEFLTQEDVSAAKSKKNQFKNSSVIFALTSLVPTLIHVYVFTGLFMLFGALKSRSKTGLLSIAFFIGIPLLLVFSLPVKSEGNYLSNYGKEAYYADGTGFFNTNVSIMRQFELSKNMSNNDYIDYFVKDSVEKQRMTFMFKDSLNKDFIIQNEEHPYYLKPIALADVKQGSYKDNWWSAVFLSSAGLMLMRFIAFAYLYHYLNWFSKTEVIRWHKVPKVRFIGVVTLWIISCGLYLYDYAIGLSFLFFLSFTHVLLEFPLNVTSIIGIGKETRSILKNGFSKKQTN
tara:strand:- start:1042 stop:2460 length:1419 start_codon:yes stop_codon:yes gene_type:complete